MNRREFLRQSALTVGAASALSPLAFASLPEESLRTVDEMDASLIRRLRPQLHGQALLPGDRGYESACQDWVGRIPKRPGLVVRCAAGEDVATAVKFARDQELLVAVRGGGHTPHSACEGGMLINVSGLKQIDLDRDRRAVRVEPGLTVGEMDQATCALGLATVLGECPLVGISGMSLGGGLGRLMGQHAALCDNLLSADVITADGRALRASADENPDLFWAIRGGGGNFGIVTSFEYRLHPVGQVLSGMLRYPISEARTVLRFLGEWMPTVPDEIDAVIEFGSGILQYAPDAQEPTMVINVFCAGEPRSAEQVLHPLRTFARPAADTVRPMPYLEAQHLGDVGPLVSHLSSRYSASGKRGFLTRLNGDAIEAIADHCERPPSTSWSMALDHYLHGAVCRVPPTATAFSLRQNGYSVRLTAFEEGPGPAKAAIEWVQSLHGALEPFSADRIYLNYVSEQTGPVVRAAFGPNYARLLELKKKYDPTNFFRLNPNIRS